MKQERRETDNFARGRRLRLARKAAGYQGPTDVIRRHPSWNINTYKAHELGRNGFDADTAAEYAIAFNTTVDWLYYARGDAPIMPDEYGPRRVSDEEATVGRVTGRRGIPPDGIPQFDLTAGLGGGGVTMHAEGVPHKSGHTYSADVVRGYWRLPDEVLGALGLRARDVAILPVQGDSMADTLTEGDFVFVDIRHTLPSPDGLYALADEFGGVVVKRLEVVSPRSEEDALIRVISDNPRHSPKERRLSEMAIFGRVVRRFGVVG
ncbi:MAG: S24 family peptidase [Bauldia sp.]|nr:S24 family peptidase [Bauldia sp.]